MYSTQLSGIQSGTTKHHTSAFGKKSMTAPQMGIANTQQPLLPQGPNRTPFGNVSLGGQQPGQNNVYRSIPINNIPSYLAHQRVVSNQRNGVK